MGRCICGARGIPCNVGRNQGNQCRIRSFARTNELGAGGVLAVTRARRRDVGQCNPMYQQLYDIVAISAGKQYSLAMDKNGKVYGWGVNTSGQARIPATLARATVIEAGYVNSVVGYEDGSMRSFGDAAHGALQSRTPTRSVTRTP